MPDAVDILNPRVWTGVVRETPVPAEYIMERFLPMRDTPADRISWDVLVSENPMAPFVAIDAESPRMDDELLKSASADIAYIRYKRSLKESDVRTVRSLTTAPVVTPTPLSAMADTARAKIARQAVRLSNAIDTTVEWMRVQSLLGSLAVTAGTASNVTFTLTYPVQTQTVGTAWSNTASDPLLDLINYFKDQWFDFRYMICSRQVLYHLARNTKMLRQMFAAIGGGTDPTVVSNARVEQMLAGELGLTVVTYDAYRTTRTDTGTAVALGATRLLPADKVIFLPAEPVGYTATAPAPQNNYQTGKFAWVDEPGVNMPQDPWRYELGAGFYGLPVIEQPTKILVVDTEP